MNDQSQYLIAAYNSVEWAQPAQGGQELGEGGVQESQQGALHLHRGGQDPVSRGLDRRSLPGH